MKNNNIIVAIMAMSIAIILVLGILAGIAMFKMSNPSNVVLPIVTGLIGAVTGLIGGISFRLRMSGAKP